MKFIYASTSTEQAESFWRSGSGRLCPRISTTLKWIDRNLGATAIGRMIRMRSDA
ncbi:hypothetical protein ACFW1P_07360 [Paenibacillus sp. NPDC058910]|uniref:hypothetical protein n=1 Tax=Paenibacillus sp. NPDC058910 TaxID=3346670 RepID=UPI00367CCBC6